MLRIYPVALELAADIAAIADRIALKDNDLARQLRRAMVSVPLNLAEGAGVTAGHRKQRYGTALGSAGEVVACLETAHAMRYCGGATPATAGKLDHIIGTLVKLTR